MSVASWIAVYFAVNGAITAGAFLSWIFSKWVTRSRDLLWLNYSALGLILVALAVSFVPLQRSALFEPPVKVWARSDPSDSGLMTKRPVVKILSHQAHESVLQVSTLGLLVLPLLGFVFLIRESYLLTCRVRNLPRIRRVGSTEIYASHVHEVPFAFWLPGRAFVVIPYEMLMDPKKARMALAHELQHHRQGDTKWLFALFILRSICFLNPCVHFWARRIAELQEYACDETLVDRKKVDSHAYARCLVETALKSQSFARHPASATGMAFRAKRQHLKWRIEKMFSVKINAPGLGRPMKWLSFLTLASVMSISAVAARAAVGDKRISLAQAHEMAKRADPSFPVIVNEEVLRQLNQMVGTPEGRKWVSESIARMKNALPLMKPKFETYSAPVELYAIPLVESGYKNLAQTPKKGTGAGIWQFIGSTARIFKLRVDQDIDERLDIEKETDAALRLLGSDRLRFDDWSLAILSFNAGEQSVQAAIDRTGSRDPWVLVRSGLKTDANYLAKVHAAILILKNPQAFE